MEEQVVQEEVLEEQVQEQQVITPEEATVLVRSQTDFKDGVFRPAFEALGHKHLWKTGELREIPVSLFMKLNKRSGNKFHIAKR